MDIMKSPLVILFKEQNPYKVLSNYFSLDSYKKNNHRNLDKKTFSNLYIQYEPAYSSDDIENIFNMVKCNMVEAPSEIKIEGSVFNIVLKYACRILENHGDNIKCRYKDLLKWRMATLKLDQDLFISAFLAYEDLMIGSDRKYFDWDNIIKSNNIRLNTMMSKGMAENHFHLNGSAPYFKLSWVSIMNDLSARNIAEHNLDNNRLDKDLDENINLNNAIVIAALIRTILFNEINREKNKLTKSSNSDDTIYKLKRILKKCVEGWEINSNEKNSYYNGEIQNEISMLKHIYGKELDYKGSKVKVDYALVGKIDTEDLSTRLFAGERAFMYDCFKKIYSGTDEFKEYIDLFYAYIIIKNKVRGELIQNNNRVGFSNFSDYQNRKTQYIKNNTILKDAIEPTAILTSIKNQNIISLEARVIPDKNSNININGIDKTDKIICHQVYNDGANLWINKFDESADVIEKQSMAEINLMATKEEKKEIENLKQNFFYVFHFPKSKDKAEECKIDDLKLVGRCRHYNYRKDLKKWGYAIYKMREKNQKVAERVLGIDACSNELVTRPEVYGQVFRFLKAHIPLNNYQRDFIKGRTIPRLRATYHVGEDFLDIVDGLRAIDETINFLNFTHGDRLGHAIVLGIDVQEWYNKKQNKVYLKQQDILDNIAWLITKVKEFNITNSPEIVDKLLPIYNRYLQEISYMNLEEVKVKSHKTKTDNIGNVNNFLIPVDTYMEAWKLRGDNPESYLSEDNNSELSFWDRCSKRRDNDIAQNNEIAVKIYLNYHYNPNIKVKGNKKEAFKIEKYMIKTITEVQKKMQEEICKRGIAVECNPSSNYLISNFKRYDKHPILNMYNLGLTIDEDIADNLTQLFVSINTDDQGVFDTLLENEFALMGIALEKAKNEDGSPKYNQTMIYDWLDRIRQMGLEQSFRITNKSSNKY